MTSTFRSDMTVELIDHMGSDDMIANAAWVSTKAEKAKLTSDNIPFGELETFQKRRDGVINFLLKNRHGTPFEHGAMTFFVQAPIFVFREWHRHRIGWSYNEESARYRQLEPVFYVPYRERNLTQSGKPGHYVFEPGTDKQYSIATSQIKVNCNSAYEKYELLLMGGIAKEVARSVLPVNIYSSMYATCNPRSMMNFLQLRTRHEDAMFPSTPQREIEMCAEQMEAFFMALFPSTYESFVKNGRVAP